MIAVFVGKSGKTTNAVNVAGVLAQLGRRVLFLDADPQGSAVEWNAQRTRPPLFEVREYCEPTIFAEVDTLSAEVDDVVVDCPAGTGRPGRVPSENIQIIRNAILAATSERNGVVVGIVVPSGWELWAADDLMEVIERAWEHPSAAALARTRTVLLLNRAKTTRRGGAGRPDRVPRMVRAARTRLEAAPLPMLTTVMHDWGEVIEAPIHGLTVTEFAPRSAASAEVRALTDELLTLAGEKK